MPLEMLGKYERLDVLGHGTSGIVYLAKDTLLGKQVALKEISAQGEEKGRFLEEARVLDRLRHPNIVQVNSVDEIGGKVVIDMEYVRGRNLQDILRDTPQLPLEQALSITAQVCDGLAFAHAHRTVHRDIKPANILLTTEGIVKIVDFGLAAQLGTHSFAGGAGTYAYMAPEDFHPEEQSDRQSDIWAVGVILFEMLAGRRPFQVAKSKDPFAWKRAIELDPLPPVTLFRPDAPDAVETILARALARDKAARYREAGAMAADLRELALLDAPVPVPSLFPQNKQDIGRGSFSERNSFPERSSLPGFPADMAEIDTFLNLAPDRWQAACDALAGRDLMRWLRAIGEDPLAAVAAELAGETTRTVSDSLRDFLYRAGLDTADVARYAFEEGRRLVHLGRFASSLPFLRRAAHLDTSRADYAQELVAALRATGAGAEATLVLEGLAREDLAQEDAVPLPLEERPPGRERAAPTETRVPVSAEIQMSTHAVDFGVLRRGQTRTAKITLQHDGRGAMEGRVIAAPGWVRVDPPAFSTRKRQSLSLTAVTEGVWSAPATYSETVVLETSGGRQEIAVDVSVLPSRLSWSRIAVWFLPLLLCAALPAGAGFWAQMHSRGAAHLWQPGFVASGLLFLSIFVLTLAADITWATRLLPLALTGLCAWSAVHTSHAFFGSDPALSRLALVQTATPVLVLLILQTCAFALDADGWGSWKLWRWIIPLVAVLVGYLLLHLS